MNAYARTAEVSGWLDASFAAAPPCAARLAHVTGSSQTPRRFGVGAFWKERNMTHEDGLAIVYAIKSLGFPLGIISACMVCLMIHAITSK